MDNEPHITSYSDALETILAEEGEKCRGYAYLHSKCSDLFRNLDYCFQIPVIILSTITGTASMGSQSLFGSNVGTASVVIGSVSLLVGVLNTLSSTFAFAKRCEGHRIASLTYSKLFSFVNIELSLPRRERMNPEDFIKMIREQTERLGDTAPPILPSVIREFNIKFSKEQDIAKPFETNGLHKIKIYKDSESIFARAVQGLMRQPSHLDQVSNVV